MEWTTPATKQMILIIRGQLYKLKSTVYIKNSLHFFDMYAAAYI